MKQIFSFCFLIVGLLILGSSAQAGAKKTVTLNVQGQGDVDFLECDCLDPMIQITCDRNFSVRSLYALTDLRTKFFRAYADTIQGMPNFYGFDDEPEYLVGLGEAWTEYREGSGGQGAELVSALGVGNDLSLTGGAKILFFGNTLTDDGFPESVHVWGSALIETEEGATCEISFDDWMGYQ